MLWACAFALTFIFWYEASGMRLVGGDTKDIAGGSYAVQHFWGQFNYGALFLLFGTVLTVTLAPRDEGRRPPYQLLDWIALAAGLGALLGTAYRSWNICQAAAGG